MNKKQVGIRETAKKKVGSNDFPGARHVCTHLTQITVVRLSAPFLL